MKNSLDRAKAEMEEASKTARAEARKKSGSQVTKKDPTGNSNKPAVGSEASNPAKAESPKAASLFDRAPEPATDAPASGHAPSDEDEEILRESYVGGEAEEGDEAA